jgi:hypothetical protein
MLRCSQGCVQLRIRDKHEREKQQAKTGRWRGQGCRKNQQLLEATAMQKRMRWFCGLAVLWTLSAVEGMAQDQPATHSLSQGLLRQHLADYNSELRRADGRVDIEAMAARLKELGVTTYYWLVWHATLAPNPQHCSVSVIKERHKSDSSRKGATKSAKTPLTCRTALEQRAPRNRESHLAPVSA